MQRSLERIAPAELRGARLKRGTDRCDLDWMDAQLAGKAEARCVRGVRCGLSAGHVGRHAIQGWCDAGRKRRQDQGRPRMQEGFAIVGRHPEFGAEVDAAERKSDHLGQRADRRCLHDARCRLDEGQDAGLLAEGLDDGRYPGGRRLRSITVQAESRSAMRSSRNHGVSTALMRTTVDEVLASQCATCDRASSLSGGAAAASRSG